MLNRRHRLSHVSQIALSKFSNFMRKCVSDEILWNARYYWIKDVKNKSKLEMIWLSLKTKYIQMKPCSVQLQYYTLLLKHYTFFKASLILPFWPNFSTQLLFCRTPFCFILVIEHHFNLSKTWQFRIQDNQNTALCSFTRMITFLLTRISEIEKGNRS